MIFRPSRRGVVVVDADRGAPTLASTWRFSSRRSWRMTRVRSAFVGDRRAREAVPAREHHGPAGDREAVMSRFCTDRRPRRPRGTGKCGRFDDGGGPSSSRNGWRTPAATLPPKKHPTRSVEICPGRVAPDRRSKGRPGRTELSGRKATREPAGPGAQGRPRHIKVNGPRLWRCVSGAPAGPRGNPVERGLRKAAPRPARR